MSYRAPGVYSERDIVGSPLAVGGNLVLGIIGSSLGRKVVVKNEEVVKSAGNTETLKSGNIYSVSSLVQDEMIFREAVHWDLGVDKKSVVWKTNKMVAPPELVSVVADGSGVVTKTYFYVVSAVNSYGESLSGNEVKVAVYANTTKVVLNWTRRSCITSYKVFRTEVSGSYVTPCLVATVVGTTTYEDTLTAVVAGAPVTANTAREVPASGSKYYISYSYRDLLDLYNVPKLFYDVNQVYAEHGVGSGLAKASQLAFGNGAVSVMCVASEGADSGSYLKALETLKGKKINIIVSLYPIDSQLLAFVENQSSEDEKNEMLMMSGPSIGMSIGDVSAPNTIIYNATGLANRRVEYVDNWCKSYIRQLDDSYKEEVLDGRYLACAVGGKRCSLTDVTVSLTGKVLTEVSGLGVDRLESEMNTLASNGVKVIWSDRGVVKVRHDVTTSVATLEDSESAVVYGDDELIKALRVALEHFIGSKITVQILDGIKLETELFLENRKIDEKIFSYRDLGVVQDITKKTRVIVSFRYQPVYPVNEIEVRYGFDLG